MLTTNNMFYFEYSCRKNGKFIDIVKGGPKNLTDQILFFLYLKAKFLDDLELRNNENLIKYVIFWGGQCLILK